VEGGTFYEKGLFRPAVGAGGLDGPTLECRKVLTVRSCSSALNCLGVADL